MYCGIGPWLPIFWELMNFEWTRCYYDSYTFDETLQKFINKQTIDLEHVQRNMKKEKG
jgi:hypothetical protein